MISQSLSVAARPLKLTLRCCGAGAGAGPWATWAAGAPPQVGGTGCCCAQPTAAERARAIQGRRDVDMRAVIAGAVPAYVRGVSRGLRRRAAVTWDRVTWDSAGEVVDGLIRQETASTGRARG